VWSAITLADPPTETNHWTADLMGAGSDISARRGPSHLEAHGLQNLTGGRQFKLSNDPNFVAKLSATLSGSMSIRRPCHRASVDEKRPDFQARDRTSQASVKKAGSETMTQDYSGTATTERCSPPSKTSPRLNGHSAATASVIRHQETHSF